MRTCSQSGGAEPAVEHAETARRAPGDVAGPSGAGPEPIIPGQGR